MLSPPLLVLSIHRRKPPARRIICLADPGRGTGHASREPAPLATHPQTLRADHEWPARDQSAVDPPAMTAPARIRAMTTTIPTRAASAPMGRISVAPVNAPANMATTAATRRRRASRFPDRASAAKPVSRHGQHRSGQVRHCEPAYGGVLAPIATAASAATTARPPASAPSRNPARADSDADSENPGAPAPAKPRNAMLPVMLSDLVHMYRLTVLHWLDLEAMYEFAPRI